MQMKLSAAKLKTLAVPAGKTTEYVWDTSLPGFGVCVGKTVKTYVVQFTTRPGEQKRHKIGRSDVLGYDDARKEAIRILSEVQKGADPTAAIRQARREGLLTDELVEWFDAHSIKPSTRKTWRSIVHKHIIPTLGSRKPSVITKVDVTSAYRTIEAKSGKQANQAIVILSAFYNITTDGKYNPASDFRNDKAIRKHRDGEREVVLSSEQVRALLDDCDKSPAQQTADAIRLLLLTGARLGEILSLQWKNVNVSQGTITIVHTQAKEAKTKTLHLSPNALAILEKRRAEAGRNAEYVFPGKDGSGHQTVVKAYWAGACRRCGIEGVHVHDLRATYSTHLIASGESAKAVGKTMGHADTKTTMRYERIAQDRAKDIAKKIDSLY